MQYSGDAETNKKLRKLCEERLLSFSELQLKLDVNKGSEIEKVPNNLNILTHNNDDIVCICIQCTIKYHCYLSLATLILLNLL